MVLLQLTEARDYVIQIPWCKFLLVDVGILSGFWGFQYHIADQESVAGDCLKLLIKHTLTLIDSPSSVGLEFAYNKYARRSNLNVSK